MLESSVPSGVSSFMGGVGPTGGSDAESEGKPATTDLPDQREPPPNDQHSQPAETPLGDQPQPPAEALTGEHPQPAETPLGDQPQPPAETKGGFLLALERFWSIVKGWLRDLRGKRSRRDVLAPYRADFEKGVRFFWWQRLRAVTLLLVVTVLLGLLAAAFIAAAFFGLAFLLESLAS